MITNNNIVLDIDETLIKSRIYNNSYIEYLKTCNSDTKKTVFNTYPELKNIIDNDEDFIDLLFLTSFTINEYTYIIFMRPYLREFLIYINEHFNIYIYSLGTENYIIKILEEEYLFL